jgi:hypothetical protein
MPKKKSGKLLVMPKPAEAEPQVAGFTLAIGNQRLKFDLKLTSQEIRDGELVTLGTIESSSEVVVDVKPAVSKQPSPGRRK